MSGAAPKGRVELLAVENPVTGGEDLVAVARLRHVLRIAPALGLARPGVTLDAKGAQAWQTYAGVRYRNLFSLERELDSPLADDRLLDEWDAFRFPSPGGFATLSLLAPLGCEPVVIPKPWGREIWYSGMETRGVCELGRPGHTVPLTWALAAGRDDLFGKGVEEMILLKILDPAPVPVFGDLYTEVHARKNEVYVCTRVDPAVAGPGGEGGLRYGLSPEALAASGGDFERLKARYLEAVTVYETLRRSIDARLDERKRAEGLGPRDPVDASRLAEWHAALPAEDREEERRLREAMNAFTTVHPLVPGSVARVPVGVPHALQAGVRVVEFQTATYERRILSFAQRVLTQEHWDTREALALIDPSEAFRSPLVPPREGQAVDEIVSFPGFRVFRCRLDSLGGEGAGPLELPVGNESTYELLFVVEGEFLAGSEVLQPGQAYVVPRARAFSLTGTGVVLRAVPNVSVVRDPG